MEISESLGVGNFYSFGVFFVNRFGGHSVCFFGVRFERLGHSLLRPSEIP